MRWTTRNEHQSDRNRQERRSTGLRNSSETKPVADDRQPPRPEMRPNSGVGRLSPPRYVPTHTRNCRLYVRRACSRRLAVASGQLLTSPPHRVCVRMSRR